MALSACRECSREVSADAPICPHCGAPRPTQPQWTGPGFEWKSEFNVFGMPFIHIAFGRDKHGFPRVARGFIAIGQFAFGFITVAQFGVGLLFGLGQFMLGLTVVAQFAGGILFSLGQLAAGWIAIGQLAVGHYGLCQIGRVAEPISRLFHL